MSIKSLTIFCSSSNLLNNEFYELADQIGEFLCKKEISIVYGGGTVGIMGRISKSSYNLGGNVIGIIPKFLVSEEKINKQTTKTIIVKNMVERKKKLFELADAFLILPGGSGTIEEATEVISWKYLKLHKKPIIFVNYKNYWNPLIEMYEKSKKNNFGNKNLQNMCDQVKTFEEFSKIFK